MPAKIWIPADWAEVCQVLRDADAPLAHKYRALFSVRQKMPNDEEGAKVLLAALEGSCKESVLLRHECCYLIGQIGHESASTQLRDVLTDASEDEVVRHEAAEGLAAMGSLETADLLAEIGASDNGPLAQTCRIAAESLRKGKKQMCACQYTSVDPAEGDPDATLADVPRYSSLLLSDATPLWERYVAMFTLRNLGSDECIDALSRCLVKDESSALMRHEIAFVLGQIASEQAVSALKESLAREGEHSMVRHEAAIALGTVGTEEAAEILRDFESDPEPMVAESCTVALATIEYWNYWEELEQRIGQAA